MVLFLNEGLVEKSGNKHVACSKSYRTGYDVATILA